MIPERTLSFLLAHIPRNRPPSDASSIFTQRSNNRKPSNLIVISKDKSGKICCLSPFINFDLILCLRLRFRPAFHESLIYIRTTLFITCTVDARENPEHDNISAIAKQEVMVDKAKTMAVRMVG